MELSVQLFNERIDSIVRFLSEEQTPDGEFRMLRSFTKTVGDYVRPTKYQGWYDFGRSTFATATILYHLQHIHHPTVERMKEKACNFLKRRIEAGVFRYTAAYDKPIDIPPDIDCTCIALAALQSNGCRLRGNRSMILSNTDRQGNFYTWFIPRQRHLKQPQNFFWLVRDRWTWKRRMLSYGTSAGEMVKIEDEYKHRNEPAVAANALLYLGIDPRTKISLETMIRRIERGDLSLEYYGDNLVAFFHLARLYQAGVERVLDLKPMILSTICSRQSPDGNTGGPFNTALASLVWIYFKCWDDVHLNKAIHYLALHEMHEKGWLPFHYANDCYNVFQDGSAGLLALFYLEALYRCRQHYFQ